MPEYSALPALPPTDVPAAPAASSPAPAGEHHGLTSVLRKVAVAGVAFAGGWQLTEWAIAAIPPVVSFLRTVTDAVVGFVTSAASLVADVAVAAWNGGVATLQALDAGVHAHPYLAIAAVAAGAAAAAWHFRGEHDEHECGELPAPEAVPARSESEIELR